MRPKFSVVFLLTIILSYGVLAQEDYAQQTTSFKEVDPNIFQNQTVWGVGLQAGLCTGMGIGVRYHPAGRFGTQLVGGPLALSDKTMYSVGAEGQFDFDARGLSRFYGYLGFGYYENGAVDDEKTTDKDEREEDKLKSPFRIGLGVAYEWPVSSKMVFNVNAAFTWFTGDGTILPLPQVSLFYYFK